MKTYGNDNPVYQTATNKFGSQVNHVTGSVNFTYSPVKWFTATYLFGVDEYGDAEPQQRRAPLVFPENLLQKITRIMTAYMEPVLCMNTN